jgi:hypothetical protein
VASGPPHLGCAVVAHRVGPQGVPPLVNHHVVRKENLVAVEVPEGVLRSDPRGVLADEHISKHLLDPFPTSLPSAQRVRIDVGPINVLRVGRRLKGGRQVLRRQGIGRRGLNLRRARLGRILDRLGPRPLPRAAEQDEPKNRQDEAPAQPTPHVIVEKRNHTQYTPKVRVPGSGSCGGAVPTRISHGTLLRLS